MTLPKVYDINGVLEVLPISRNTLYAELLAGNLVGKQIGKKWIVTEVALQEYLGLDAESDNQIAPVVALEFVDTATGGAGGRYV